MSRLKTSDWLLTLAATLGLATMANAQDNQLAQRADAILGGQGQSLTQQIGYEIAPVAPCDAPACDTVPCDGLGCDSIGCDSCYLFEGFDFSLQDAICGDCPPFEIGGWLQSGYHNRSTGLFNDRPGKYAMHQAWLYAEKVADGSDGIGFGFRADVMYGLDAGDTQSFGNNPGEWDFANGFDHGAFGFAIPQLYAEVAAGDFSVKAGHFYTLLGYEVVTAPDNFFYSHAFTMYNSEAFTHTGALVTYAASDNIEVYGGWTLGWDTGFDQFGSGSSFLGGASVGVTDSLTAIFITTAGDFGANGDGYSHSIVLDWSITDDLNYVFQSDLLDLKDTGNETIGINQYLIYSVNDCVGVGGRYEWWKTDGDSYYAVTGGINYRPTPNLVLRPEVRYQWSPVTGNDPASEGEAIFGMDAILTF